jgi:hypothetical protein
MSKQLMVTLLQSGKNAQDLLVILDTIAAATNCNQLVDSASDIDQSTMDSIEF